MRVAMIAASLSIASLAVTAETAPTRLANGHWWNGRQFVRGDRCMLGEVFVLCRGRDGLRVDLDGAWLVPPFADAHNHVSYETRRAIGAGVLYLMNPTTLASTVAPPEQRRPSPGRVDVVYSMGAVTVPAGHPVELYEDILRPIFFKDKQPADFVGDAYHFVITPADVKPVISRLVAQHADFVKIVLEYSEEFAKRRDDPAYRGKRGLDPALVPLIVREAHRQGLRVAAHIETAADFRVIVEAGVDEAAHMPGYWGGELPLDHYRVTETDARAAARSGIRATATAALAQGNPDKAKLAAIQAMQRDNLRKLHAAGVPILIGTDQHPDNAVDEAQYIVRLGALTPVEALNSLTRDTPRFIFPGRRIGSLASGYEASFVAFKDNPLTCFLCGKPERVFKQGMAATFR